MSHLIRQIYRKPLVIVYKWRPISDLMLPLPDKPDVTVGYNTITVERYSNNSIRAATQRTSILWCADYYCRITPNAILLFRWENVHLLHVNFGLPRYLGIINEIEYLTNKNGRLILRFTSHYKIINSSGVKPIFWR